MRIHVYIDGFNLYYGLLRGTAYNWLDLEKICDQLLPKNTVEKIYDFMAKVEVRQEDPEQSVRQLAFLNALATLSRVEVHLGTFMSPVVGQPVVDTNVTGGCSIRILPIACVRVRNGALLAWLERGQPRTRFFCYESSAFRV